MIIATLVCVIVLLSILLIAALDVIKDMNTENHTLRDDLKEKQQELDEEKYLGPRQGLLPENRIAKWL